MFISKKSFIFFNRALYILSAAMLLAGLVFTTVGKPGIVLADAIWTTNGGCGTPEQDVNHFTHGATVYINGAGINPGTYAWSIKGKPGGASADPDKVVASGSYTITAGTFCFAAYVVKDDDGGEYQVKFKNKGDNYRVDWPATPTDPTPTQPTPTDPTPTDVTPTQPTPTDPTPTDVTPTQPTPTDPTPTDVTPTQPTPTDPTPTDVTPTQPTPTDPTPTDVTPTEPTPTEPTPTGTPEPDVDLLILDPYCVKENGEWYMQWVVLNPNETAILVTGWTLDGAAQAGTFLAEPGETSFAMTSLGTHSVELFWGEESSVSLEWTIGSCKKPKVTPTPDPTDVGGVSTEVAQLLIPVTGDTDLLIPVTGVEDVPPVHSLTFAGLGLFGISLLFTGLRKRLEEVPTK